MRKSGLMQRIMRRVRLALCLLAACLQALGPAPVAGWRIAGATLLVTASLIADTSPAEARRGGGSGGYSRPSSSGGSGSRTPSVSNYGSGGGSSGGYARPSRAGSPADTTSPALRTPPVSGTDRTIARNQSGDALNAFRAQQAPPPQPQPVPAQPAPSRPAYDNRTTYETSSRPLYVPRQGYSVGYSQNYSYSQTYQNRFPGMPERFGSWPSGFLIGMLIGAVASPGNAAFFHHHANDPGVRSFIDRARSEPGLSDPVGNLDRALTPYAGQSRDPNYLPPGVDPGSITADKPADKPSGSGGGIGGFLVVLLLLAALGLVGFGIWRWWAKRSQGSGMSGGINQAARIIGRKLEKDPYRPAYVRVGMVVTLDPTPFLLLGRSGGVAPPAAGTASVAALSRLDAGQAPLTRLYLAKGGAFIELAFTASGEPERARYFDKIDEVHPATPEEWGFWLDDGDGMIGWPEFELKDGTKFARVFGAGNGGRIPPLRWTETRESADGSSGSGAASSAQAQQRRLSAMLYARPSGAPEPAPQWDYLLIAAAEAGRGAWVELYRGIDLNPASLKLA